MTETIAAILGAIVGGVIGVAGAYFVALRTAQNSRRADANITFYEAFRKTIRDFQSTANPPTDPQRTLNSHIEEHRSAAFRFKFFLQEGERRLFITAWDEYYKKYKEQAFADDSGITKRSEKRQLALNLIYKLLEFADYKHTD